MISTASSLHPAWIRTRVSEALREDVPFDDVTSEACISPTAHASALVQAREPMVVAGLPLLVESFGQTDARVHVQALVNDGARVEANTTLAKVEGPTQSVLTAERTALNFLQHMSGVATMTRAYVDARVLGSRTRITDTRKTIPGMRALQRYAVRCGGGHSHRNDLSSAVLIKDNHIAACGSVAIAVARAKEYAPHTSGILCEVDEMAQIEAALDAGANALMLDNFSDEEVARAIDLIRGRAWVEVSGGIDEARVQALSALRVDAISVGALTHSVRAVDIGLDFERMLHLHA